jgi:hypothetical protein
MSVGCSAHGGGARADPELDSSGLDLLRQGVRELSVDERQDLVLLLEQEDIRTEGAQNRRILEADQPRAHDDGSGGRDAEPQQLVRLDRGSPVEADPRRVVRPRSHRHDDPLGPDTPQPGGRDDLDLVGAGEAGGSADELDSRFPEDARVVLDLGHEQTPRWPQKVVDP